MAPQQAACPGMDTDIDLKLEAGVATGVVLSGAGGVVISRLLAAGLADICRHECGAVHDVQGFSRLAIVVLAEWNDVPALVRGAVFLDTSAKFYVLTAGSLPARRRKNPAEFLPMFQPTPAFTGIVARSVDIVRSHRVFPLSRPQKVIHG